MNMTHTHEFDSVAERKAAPSIAQLGGVPCQSFLPQLSKHYQDADGVQHVGKPDFLITRSRCFTFVDTKDGVLHNHYTFASCDDAQKDAYRFHFHRSGDHLTHWDRSDALYYDNQRGKVLSLETGWNHSLHKLLALQALHGWQRFLVVFKSNPTKRDAERYVNAGLVFCTMKTLPDLMLSIELSQSGFLIPFVFKTRTYAFTVTPDPASRGQSPAQVEASDRAKLLAAVAREDLATQKAHDDADDAAGLQPF